MSADPTLELADELRRRGLAAPARLLLDAHRPLRPLLDEAATFLMPTIGRLLGTGGMRIRATLADDATYDRLVARLETHESASEERGA
jgi:hypothetical protein